MCGQGSGQFCGMGGSLGPFVCVCVRAHACSYMCIIHCCRENSFLKVTAELCICVHNFYNCTQFVRSESAASQHAVCNMIFHTLKLQHPCLFYKSCGPFLKGCSSLTE